MKRYTMGGPVVLPPGPIDLGHMHATPGFAAKIEDDTDLGFAVLIVEDEAGHYEPVEVVSSVSEAREFIQGDVMTRKRQFVWGGTPLYPHVYKLWARGINGEYRLLREIPAEKEER